MQNNKAGFLHFGLRAHNLLYFFELHFYLFDWFVIPIGGCEIVWHLICQL